jgi:hypothetical protein
LKRRTWELLEVAYRDQSTGTADPTTGQRLEYRYLNADTVQALFAISEDVKWAAKKVNFNSTGTASSLFHHESKFE